MRHLSFWDGGRGNHLSKDGLRDDATCQACLKQGVCKLWVHGEQRTSEIRVTDDKGLMRGMSCLADIGVDNWPSFGLKSQQVVRGSWSQVVV